MGQSYLTVKTWFIFIPWCLFSATADLASIKLHLKTEREMDKLHKVLRLIRYGFPSSAVLGI